MKRAHGKIDHLPGDMKAKVDRLILDGGATYEEIKVWLAQQDLQISVSSIGRYAKRILSIRDTARQARMYLEEIQAAGLDIDQALDGLAGQALLDLVARLDPDEAGDLSQVVPALVRVQTLGLRRRELELKEAAAIRAAEALERTRQVAEEVKDSAKAGGLSDEAAAAIRDKILGIGA